MSDLIAISGKARSGKDTVSNILRLSSAWRTSSYFKLRYPNEKDFIVSALKLHSQVAYEPSQYKAVAFADILKCTISFIFGIEDVNVLYDEIGKNSPNNLEIKGEDGHILTNREVLQKFGTEVGRNFDSDLWIKSTFNYMDKESTKYIITDVRFENELNACIDHGFTVIRVNRDVEDMNHSSEHELDNCDKFNYIIDNNGTIEELVDKVLALNLV